MSLPPLPDNLRALAVAWFRKADWPRWCALDTDFEPDYQYWLDRAESALQQAQAMGHRVEKIIIDPDEFIEWSRVNGGKVDSGARSIFAAFKMERKDTYH